MDRGQALRALQVGRNPTREEIKSAYRRLALEHHPDRGGGGDGEFKRITEAYECLRGVPDPGPAAGGDGSPGRRGAGRRGGAAGGGGAGETAGRGGPGRTPEEDWSRYTREAESDPAFWKEYERRFWEEYDARAGGGREAAGGGGPAEEPAKPGLSVGVDESLCIGCCSCEVMAPGVFRIDRETKSNPKSSVIDPGGAGAGRIVDAARTCPTKAIRVDDLASGERLFPY